MGREQARSRKHVHVCVASLILLSFVGCSTFEKRKEKIHAEVAVASKGTEESPKVSLPLKEKNDQGDLREQLARNQKLLVRGDFEGFSKETQKVLSLSGSQPPADDALLNLGMVFVHPGNPKKDYGKSLGFFRKLLKDFPQSPWAEQARIWIAVLQENEKVIQSNEKLTQTNEKLTQANEKLNEMIEKSKQIDIEIEERKREKLK